MALKILMILLLRRILKFVDIEQLCLPLVISVCGNDNSVYTNDYKQYIFIKTANCNGTCLFFLYHRAFFSQSSDYKKETEKPPCCKPLIYKDLRHARGRKFDVNPCGVRTYDESPQQISCQTPLCQTGKILLTLRG